MGAKRTNKQYPTELKNEAAPLIHKQGFSVAESVKSLGNGTSLLHKWNEKVEAQNDSKAVSDDDKRSTLKRLHDESIFFVLKKY